MNVLEVVVPFASAVFAAGGAYIAVRLELKYLRRDVDHAHKRIDGHDAIFLEQVTHHGR